MHDSTEAGGLGSSEEVRVWLYASITREEEKNANLTNENLELRIKVRELEIRAENEAALAAAVPLGNAVPGVG